MTRVTFFFSSIDRCRPCTGWTRLTWLSGTTKWGMSLSEWWIRSARTARMAEWRRLKVPSRWPSPKRRLAKSKPPFTARSAIRWWSASASGKNTFRVTATANWSNGRPTETMAPTKSDDTKEEINTERKQTLDRRRCWKHLVHPHHHQRQKMKQLPNPLTRVFFSRIFFQTIYSPYVVCANADVRTIKKKNTNDSQLFSTTGERNVWQYSFQTIPLFSPF